MNVERGTFVEPPIDPPLVPDHPDHPSRPADGDAAGPADAAVEVFLHGGPRGRVRGAAGVDAADPHQVGRPAGAPAHHPRDPIGEGDVTITSVTSWRDLIVGVSWARFVETRNSMI